METFFIIIGLLATFAVCWIISYMADKFLAACEAITEIRDILKEGKEKAICQQGQTERGG